MLPFRGDAAYAAAGAIGENDEGIIPEELRYGVLIIPEVVLEGVFQASVAGFQLDEDERNAVDKAHQIGAAFV